MPRFGTSFIADHGHNIFFLLDRHIVCWSCVMRYNVIWDLIMPSGSEEFLELIKSALLAALEGMKFWTFCFFWFVQWLSFVNSVWPFFVWVFTMQQLLFRAPYLGLWHSATRLGCMMSKVRFHLWKMFLFLRTWKKMVCLLPLKMPCPYFLFWLQYDTKLPAELQRDLDMDLLLTVR
jgi:hypothetical protein